MLVVGAGGLGVPVLQYLAAAGVGRIGIVDGDVVEGSNLHRQPLYGIADVGRPKAVVAAERLAGINGDAHLEVFDTDALNAAPRIVATQEGRVLLSRGETAYVRGDLGGATLNADLPRRGLPVSTARRRRDSAQYPSRRSIQHP